MGTGASLTASERLQRLQTALHAKAKEASGFRFYTLSDKVWRDDVLVVAWQAVRRNGVAAGVDGENSRGLRVVRGGPVVGSTGAGPEGGDLLAACGSAGPHPEEAAWKIPTVGHSHGHRQLHIAATSRRGGLRSPTRSIRSEVDGFRS